MSDACETPLVELLDKVPDDARLIYEHSPTHSQAIPVGRHAREAAALIRALLRDLDEARADLARVTAERDALQAAIKKARENWAREGDGDLVWFVFDAAMREPRT